ncbi:MAG: hypothetical protein ACN4GZ_09155 [Acidimicrobiales bacterium]
MNTQERPAPSGSAPFLVRVLVIVSSMTMLLGLLSAYASDVVFDSDEAGDIAAKALAREEIRSAVSVQVVDQIVVLDPELLVVRPVIEIVVDQVLGSPEVADIVRFGVADLHRTVFTDNRDTLSIELAELVLLVKVSLAKLDPDLAEQIPDDVTDGVIALRTDPVLVDALQLAETMRFLSFILPILSFVGFALAIWLSDDRRRAFITVGVSAIGVGAAVLLLEAVARFLFVRRFDGDDSRLVADAVWDVVMGDLAVFALIVAAAGSVLAVVASTGSRRMSLRGHVRTAVGLIEPPESKPGRVIWGLAALVLGAYVVADGEMFVRLATVVAGMGMVTVGLSEAVAALSGSDEEITPSAARGALRTTPIRWVVGGFFSVALLAIVLVAIGRSGGDGVTASSGGPGCNGSVVLCGRPLDRVAFAATHNSMAAADDGFSGAYQTVGIIPQLEDGYRGFLIDAYYGIESDDVVFTDRAPVSEEERAELVRDVGESAVRSAEALRESLQLGGGTRDVYLCHSFCEIGAVSMVDEMSRVREWLEAHPREVLIFVIQDEGPTELDMETVFSDSGLAPYLHSQALGEPWPTLGDMVESGRRVWVSAENLPGQEAWYHDAFAYIQDTPYSQPETAAFTCELLRGDPDSPLLLVNHWLSPASAVSADEANSRAVLEARLEECDAERGRFLNLLAVDFSDRGDVIAVVNELNGVAPR